MKICRLGRHTPISKVARDGILRVGTSATQKINKAPSDEWFKLLGENQLGELLRLYAQVCNHRLAPYLTQVIQDRSFLEPGESAKSQSTPTAPTEQMPTTPEGTAQAVKQEPGEENNPPRSETPSSNATNANSVSGSTTPTNQASSTMTLSSGTATTTSSNAATSDSKTSTTTSSTTAVCIIFIVIY